MGLGSLRSLLEMNIGGLCQPFSSQKSLQTEGLCCGTARKGSH